MARPTGAVRWAGLLAVLALLALPTARAEWREVAPPLPPPAGRVVKVATVAALEEAVADLRSGTTILITPGEYRLTRTLAIHGPLRDVSLRGATSRRGDVILRGRGRDDPSIEHGIWIGGDIQGLTVAHLSVRDVRHHAIVVNAGPRAPRFYDLHLQDAGQQLFKANPGTGGRGVDEGIIEQSVFEYVPRSRDWYANAIQVLAGRNWIIRDNLIRGIRAPGAEMAGPAVLAWFSASGTIVERNLFINCQREIAFGLIRRDPDDHSGGVIRGNTIYRESTVENGDVAIGIFDSQRTVVEDNTMLLRDGYPNAIEYRFPDTQHVEIRRNRTNRAIVARDGGRATVSDTVHIQGLGAEEARLQGLRNPVAP